MLDQNNLQYHTYQLQSEKLLKVVIHGLPETITENEIIAELSNQDLPVLKARRLLFNNIPSSLVLVYLERTDKRKEIYQLKNLFHLIIKVEAKRKSNWITQCFRWQTFGHAAISCRAHWRCVSCGGPHDTKECKNI